MNPFLSHLLSAFKRLGEPNSGNLPKELLALPGPDEGISPWAAWLFVGLMRHHARQQWLAETIKIRLNADLGALATAGAFGHPDVPQHGLVPGVTDWEYYFHGCGCCLTHRITGESLDVDFHDETADWFDDYFYINYLKSLKTPEFIEKRLMELHSSLEPIELSIQELLEADLLEKHPESKVVRLLPDCGMLIESVDSLENHWQNSDQRLRIAAGLGDWPLVEKELQSRGSLLPEISSRATRCRDLRFARLKRLYDQPDSRPEVLEAIADLDHAELPALLERALNAKPSGTTSVALRIIANREGDDWIKPVYQLFRRVNPNGDIPEPHIWKTCAAYLVRHGDFLAEVKKSLKRARRHELAEGALLAMEYAPELALMLFRRALRSTIPYNRTTAAAALAIIDEPWSRKELIAVLEESDDQEATADCRAALMHTHDPEAHRIVTDWETRNPHEPEAGPFISMQEMCLQTCEGYVQYEMTNLHERVLPMRGQPPPEPSPEPSRWWWPFRRGGDGR